MTFTRALATDNYGPAKFIVDGTTVANGTHSTIAAALTSASSGDTIFIRPGTYTENLTLKAGVNLAAFMCDALTPNVIISGNCTHNTAGSVSISGIQLRTNSAACLTVSGSVASIVNLYGCYINALNASAISYSSSSASSTINIYNSAGNLATTGINLFTMSSAGNLLFFNTVVTNTGNSTTASTCSAGVFYLRYSKMDSPISTSSTGSVNFEHSEVYCEGLNVTAVTTAGTATSGGNFATFASGSASALSIGSGTTFIIYSTRISSSNTNAVTGAGTIQYAALYFTNTSDTMNTTTQNAQVFRAGKWRSGNQPAFLADSAGQTDITGDGTVAAITFTNEIFDQNSNFASSTFTAPYTGRYLISAYVVFEGLTASHTIGDCTFVISNRNAKPISGNFANFRNAGNAFDITSSVFVDMDVSDTASMTTTVTGGTKVVDINTASFFSGFLVC